VAPLAVENKAPTEESDSEREARAAGIKTLLGEFFHPFINREEASNAAEFDGLIGERTQVLVDKGATAALMRDTLLPKAKLRDSAAEALRGLVSTVGFASALQATNSYPEIVEAIVNGINHMPGLRNASDTFKYGMAPLLFACAGDIVWNLGVGRPLMNDSLWLGAPGSKLAPPMQVAKQAAQPSLLRTVGENAVGVQAFTARNLLIMLVVSLVAKFASEGAANQANSCLTTALALFAGAGYAATMRAFNGGRANPARRTTGPAYLFGRTDFGDQYDALNKSGTKDAVANGMARVVKGSTNLLNEALTLRIVPELFSERSLAKFAALGFGSGLSALVGEAASKNLATGAAATAVSHAVQLVVGVLVAASWSTADVATKPVIDALRTVLEQVGDFTANGAAGLVRAVP
jgi:hypothetical protein